MNQLLLHLQLSIFALHIARTASLSKPVQQEWDQLARLSSVEWLLILLHSKIYAMADPGLFPLLFSSYSVDLKECSIG